MLRTAIPGIILVIISSLVIAQEADRGIGGTATPAAAASAVQGDFYLLVIGINDYLHFPKLQTAVDDARAVKKTLTERYGFQPQNVIELYNLDATAKQILVELRKLAGRIGPDDSLLIFYAGHGRMDDITRTGAWIPVDGSEYDPTTWLQNKVLLDYLSVNAIKARHILLVSDSCFAGDFFSRSAGAPKIDDAYVREAFAKTSREAITSGGKEPVTDAGFGGHSVFAHFFIKALNENLDTYLMPSAIFERVKGGISMNARQQAQHGMLAGTGCELGGGFVLFLKDASGGLDDLVKAREAQLSVLAKAEAEMKAKSAAEAEAMQKKEAELAALDARIAELKRKMGRAGADLGSDLDQMVAIVDQREKQAQELEAMRRKADEERKARESEIARLKEEEFKQKQTDLNTDIAKYEKVAKSAFGQDLKTRTWEMLLEKWGLAKGSVKEADYTRIKQLVGLLPLEVTAADTMVLVKGGTFMMGNDHEVQVSDFMLGKYEVTFAEYDQYCETAGLEKPSDLGSGRDCRPAVNISWYDAVNYCNWLSRHDGLKPYYTLTGTEVTCNPGTNGYRLPTEAEWEYAARGGSQSKGFEYSGSSAPEEAGWYNGNAGGMSHPVGEKGANELGLCDMSGNVWEWCWDWYDKAYYQSSPRENPAGPAAGKSRVLRGGSWYHSDASLRPVGRNGLNPAFARGPQGFRIAKSVF